MVLTLHKETVHSALRVALNMNNTALVQRAGDGYTGLAVRIAEQICRERGAPLTFIEYPDAQSVLQAGPDGWDMAFLAIDATRTDRLAFSDPYHRVEATFLVRDALGHRSCTEIMRGNHAILSTRNAAYQARLSTLAPKGPIVVAGSPDEARQRFLGGEGDALAGIRETLASVGISGTRILPDNFAYIEQAVAVPILAKGQITLINRALKTVLRRNDPE